MTYKQFKKLWIKHVTNGPVTPLPPLPYVERHKPWSGPEPKVGPDGWHSHGWTKPESDDIAAYVKLSHSTTKKKKRKKPKAKLAPVVPIEPPSDPAVVQPRRFRF